MPERERRPIHSGEILAEDVLAELGMSGRQFSEVLGISPNRISEILRGRRSITADTALRLAQWLGTSAEVWLSLQQSYDLAVARQTNGEHIRQTIKPQKETAVA